MRSEQHLFELGGTWKHPLLLLLLMFERERKGFEREKWMGWMLWERKGKESACYTRGGLFGNFGVGETDRDAKRSSTKKKINDTGISNDETSGDALGKRVHRSRETVGRACVADIHRRSSG